MPSFDGRVVQYPSVGNLRDYMSWRQVDCEFDRPKSFVEGDEGERLIYGERSYQ